MTQHETVSKQLKQQSRKTKAGHRFKRNHKAPILAIYENPRYTGKCNVPLGCNHCRGTA